MNLLSESSISRPLAEVSNNADEFALFKKDNDRWLSDSMQWFFGGWEGFARTVIFANPSYLAFVVIAKISGNRTLSRMNTFDFILSIAIGSLLGRTILTKDVALEKGVAALVVLILMHSLFVQLSINHPGVRGLVQPEPELLVHNGTYLEDRMHKNRVVRKDIQEALRHHGVASLDEVDAVVLENDGRFSVVIKKYIATKDALDPLIHQFHKDARPWVLCMIAWVAQRREKAPKFRFSI